MGDLCVYVCVSGKGGGGMYNTSSLVISEFMILKPSFKNYPRS